MLKMFFICAAVVVILNVVIPRLATARELSRHPETFLQQADPYLVDVATESFHLSEDNLALVSNLRTAMRGGMPVIQLGADDESDDTDTNEEVESAGADDADTSEEKESSESDLTDDYGSGDMMEVVGTASAPPQTPHYQLIHSPAHQSEEASKHSVIPGSFRGNITDKQSSEIATAHSNPNPLLRAETIKSQLVIKPPVRPQFDFVVGGFPKCGTTSLLKGFESHEETDMVPQELCSVAAPGLADAVVINRLDLTLKQMPSIKNKTFPGGAPKRAFKCPTAMYSFKSIIRLEKHSPRAKFIVGLRHPVKFVQSFYNYRITEIYERGLYGKETIPPFERVMEPSVKPWKGVGIHAPRFELFLQQLGKTVMTPLELQGLAQYTRIGYELAVKPSNFTVFVYTVDQLEDLDEERNGLLRGTLGSYLGLSSPINPFGHENKNHQIGDSGHPETISICDPKFATIRLELVENGKKTATWLREKFLSSHDVVVANQDHFVESLDSWGVDPCFDESVSNSSDPSGH